MHSFFKRLSPERQGEIYILLELILWGFFPVISKLSFNTIGHLFSMAISVALSLFYFVPIFIFQKKWPELRVRAFWTPMIFSTLINGVLFYLLLYIGTAYTTATNVSILLLFEVFSTTLILHLWGKESLCKRELLGSFLIVLGAFIVIFPGKFEPNIGDLLVILSVCFVPIGNYCNKMARLHVSSITLMTVRNIISLFFLLPIAFIFDISPSLQEFRQSFLLLLINGVLILGVSKVFWVEGINLLPLSKAISLSSTHPIITMFASYFLLSVIPTPWQIMGLLPTFFGVILISRKRSQ